MTNTANLSIYSHFADCPEWRIERAAAGLSESPWWSGNLAELANLSGLRPLHDDDVKLDIVFREFNRVTEADCEKLERIGYTLPSLTAGDLVAIESDNGIKIFLCAPLGWKEVTLRWALDYERMSWEDKRRAMREAS